MSFKITKKLQQLEKDCKCKNRNINILGANHTTVHSQPPSYTLGIWMLNTKKKEKKKKAQRKKKHNTQTNKNKIEMFTSIPHVASFSTSNISPGFSSKENEIVCSRSLSWAKSFAMATKFVFSATEIWVSPTCTVLCCTWICKPVGASLTPVTLT